MIETIAAERERPAWFDSCMYHFSPHYFQTPAGGMHYADQGQGPPVVMVHGNPGWSFEFRGDQRYFHQAACHRPRP